MILRRTLTQIIGLTVLASLASAQTPTDFDGDGKSEYAYVRINSDKSLTWFAQNISTGKRRNLGSLGKVGDHLILANWRGGTTPNIGVVSKNSNSNSLVWTIIDENGSQVSKEFGTEQDLVVSGGDYNGNGIADAAVVQFSGKSAKWRIYPDMLSASAGDSSTIIEKDFGKKGDQHFYASPDGAVDWIGRAARTGGSRTAISLYNVMTQETKSSTRFGSYAGKGRARPFPLRNRNGKDDLFFAVQNGSSIKLTLANMNGKALASAQYVGDLSSVVGNFSTDHTGLELGIPTRSNWIVYNPITRLVTRLKKRAGIPVDHININSFAENSIPDDDDNGGGTGGGGGGSVASCQRVAGWPGSHIYKTIGSTHFSPGDVRRNTIGLVIKPGGVGPFPSCINVVDSKGNVVAKMGLYERGGKWAARYYAGIGCGSGTPYNGSAVASRARANTGSSNIYMNMGSVCYGAIDASRCIGSSQC